MFESPAEKPKEILLIEDNPGDVLLTREAFAEVDIVNNLSVCEDGEDAIRYLHRDGEYADRPTPDLVVLDLNLPKRDGREVLAELKSNEELKRIPVVVLTTSNSPEDIAAAYDLHANCYITKPVQLDDFTEVVKSLKSFWLKVVTLPKD